MKQIFNKYYKIWFNIFSILCGWFFLMTLVGTLIDFKAKEAYNHLIISLLYSIAGTLLFTFFIGGYFHIWDLYVWPRRRLSILRGKVLRQLERHNFKIDEKEVIYGGMYKDYYFIVSPYPILGEGCDFLLFIFIAPKEDNFADIENLDHGLQLCLTESSISIEGKISSKGKTTPGFQQLIDEMDKLVSYLQVKNIKPAKVEIEENTNR